MTDLRTHPPRLAVLLPQPDEEAASPDAPVAMADLLAGESQACFDAVFVGGDEARVQRCNLARRHLGTIWLATHRELGPAAGIEQLLHACEQALLHIGVERAAPALVLLPAGNQGDEIAARLAIRFDGAALGRCLDVRWSEGMLRVQRAAYGGRAHIAIDAGRGPCFGTIRRAERVAQPATEREPGSSPELARIELIEPLPPQLVVRTSDTGEQMRPLQGASIVVAGGRGMQSEAGFALLHELAAAVGGAVGGSLPAVDAGWVSVGRQVGQSGKYVTPRVYLAVGISGTPQHLTGIGPDTRIVAINNDPQADIFRAAELGVVADWKLLLPLLLERVRADAAAMDDGAAPALRGGNDA